MKYALMLTSTLIFLAASSVTQAGDADALIALDKQWGGERDAAVLDGLLADDLLAVSPDGNGSKADQIAELTAADAPEGPYTPGDYKVKFISDGVAVMTHSTTGEEAHWSMHVWQKQGDTWKVVATASIPAAE